MKASLSDMIVSYLLKGGVLLETKGDFETEINIPIETSEGKEKQVGICIKCKDLTIRTIKE
jgi:hypothetical protein